MKPHRPAERGPTQPTEIAPLDGYNAAVAKRAKMAQQQRVRRVSHQDIAREANVSRVTVSLVLAGKDQTSEETRKRVWEVARRLRYRPNLLVRGMQTGRTNAVGVVMPSSLHFHSQIARGIHDELVAHDTVPVQLWVDPATETKATELEQIHRLVDRRMDGIIIWPADVSVPDVHFREIWQRNIPLVTVDRETTTHADHVGTYEELGGSLAAEPRSRRLTPVKQDPYHMGRVAAQILLDRIFDRAKSDEPRRIHITPELIVRGSTANAPSTK